jgi:pseudouridine 5'-phosphatase
MTGGFPGPVRAVAFDLDGLLIDSEPLFAEAARQLLAPRGLALEMDVWRALMGTPARQAILLFRQGHGLQESVDDLAEEYRRTLLDVLGEKPVPLLPGALELLDRIERQRLPHCIATSSSPAYVERVLSGHGILPRFDFVLTCDDVTEGKPHPEVYQKAAARFGVLPAEMLVLEDSINGLKAAKAAGARCVVVPHDLVAREELVGADAIVADLAAPVLQDLIGR